MYIFDVNSKKKGKMVSLARTICRNPAGKRDLGRTQGDQAEIQDRHHVDDHDNDHHRGEPEERERGCWGTLRIINASIREMMQYITGCIQPANILSRVVIN